MENLRCTCSEMVITPVEKKVADKVGLTPEQVHMFMDVWTDSFDELFDMVEGK